MKLANNIIKPSKIVGQTFSEILKRAKDRTNFQTVCASDTGEVDGKDKADAAKSLETYTFNPLNAPFATSKANGKVDAPFKQGNIGDCALLATLYSMAQTKSGAQAIEDALCSVDEDLDDDVFEVYFKGTDEVYEVTRDELKSAKTNKERRYSTGDDDVTVLELAMEKAFNNSKNETLRNIVDTYYGNEEDKLCGVDPKSVSYLLTGKKFTSIDMHTDSLVKKFTPNATKEIVDSEGNKRVFDAGKNYTFPHMKGNLLRVIDNTTKEEYWVNKNDFMSQIYCAELEDSGKAVEAFLRAYNEKDNDTALVFATKGVENVKAPDGSDVCLWGAHAYSVTSADENSVTLVNPWVTGKQVTVSTESLLGLDKYYFYVLEGQE